MLLETKSVSTHGTISQKVNNKGRVLDPGRVFVYAGCLWYPWWPLVWPRWTCHRVTGADPLPPPAGVVASSWRQAFDTTTSVHLTTDNLKKQSAQTFCFLAGYEAPPCSVTPTLKTPDVEINFNVNRTQQTNKHNKQRQQTHCLM